MWQLLLPGTAFPACGTPENSTADTANTSERTASVENRRDDKARADASEPRR